MRQPLPFFPASLPDETLLSRISRYHLLSGNRTGAATFKELMGKASAVDMVVPTHALRELSARLPGAQEEAIAQLVEENTLLPAFAPFLGTEGSPPLQDLPLGERYRTLGRIPKRSTGFYGESRLCVACLQGDIEHHGVGYWHRGHQIPGVQVCWRHGTPLLSHCQVCRRPFARHLQLLSVPWKPCACGWDARELPVSNNALPEAQRYAQFAHELLEARLPPIPPAALVLVYRKKMLEHGFAARNTISTPAFRKALFDEFDAEFIRQVDPAMLEACRHTWFRLTIVDGQLDLPLPRLILCTMFLFGDFPSFSAAVADNAGQLHRPRTRRRRAAGESEEDASPKLKGMRNRARLLQAQHPGLTLEQMWKDAYGTTAWLYEHDRRWLMNHLTISSHELTDQEKQQDEAYARLIDDRIDTLYEVAGKPVKVTKGRIRDLLLPVRLKNVPPLWESYPQVYERMERYVESYWHFSLRRLLYAATEVRRLQATPVNSHLRKLSGVHSGAFDALMEHFGWNEEEMVLPHFDPKPILARAGVGRQWSGPETMTRMLGGRRYYQEKALSSKDQSMAGQ